MAVSGRDRPAGVAAGRVLRLALRQVGLLPQAVIGWHFALGVAVQLDGAITFVADLAVSHARLHVHLLVLREAC